MSVTPQNPCPGIPYCHPNFFRIFYRYKCDNFKHNYCDGELTGCGLVYLSKTCFTPLLTVCKAAIGSVPASVALTPSSKYLIISSFIPLSKVFDDRYQNL